MRHVIWDALSWNGAVARNRIGCIERNVCATVADKVTPMAELEAFPTDWQTALAIVAHPDDMEFGAASAVARWTGEGRTIDYVLVTSGEAGIDGISPAVSGPLREDEQRASAELVGVSSVEFLGYPDGVIEPGLGLRRDLARCIRAHKPELVITGNRRMTWPGGNGFNMADHRHVGLACLDASRDAGNRWIFPELLEEGHEPWDGVKRVAFAGSPEATHGVDITGFLDRGIASLEAHAAYMKGLGSDWPPADMFLTQMAEDAGPRLGVEHAAIFEVVEF